MQRTSVQFGQSMIEKVTADPQWPGLSSFINTSTNAVAQVFLDSINPALKTIQDKLDADVKQIEAINPNDPNIGKLKEKGAKVRAAITSLIPQAQIEVNTYLQHYGEIANKIQDAQKKGGSNKEIIKITEDGVKFVNDYVNQGFVRTVGGALKTISNLVQYALKNLLGGVSGVFDQVAKITGLPIGQFVSYITKTFSDFIPGLANIAKKVLSDLTQKAKAVVHDVTKPIDSLTEDLVHLVKNILEKVLEILI